MKKLLLISLVCFLSFISFKSVFAYTAEDVETHSTATDCWMIYDQSVYDITDYLRNHDRYMDIESWCGKDMTEDFESKAGTGEDHKESSYALLEGFKIGDLEIVEEVVISKKIVESATTGDDIVSESTEKSDAMPYNIVIPIFLSVFLYWASYFIFKKQSLKSFNAFWNTLLLLTLLIPSFGFGIVMILRYRFKNLWGIDFDFMYWHVELSVVMGMLAFNHFIQRIRVYLLQLKSRKV